MSDVVTLRFRDATAKDVAVIAALLNATAGALTARTRQGVRAWGLRPQALTPASTPR